MYERRAQLLGILGLPRAIIGRVCSEPARVRGNPTDMDESIQDLVQRTLAGDRSATRHLFAHVICPVVERRLSHRLALAGADRTEFMDHVQEVLVHLLERDADVLRRWDPERGSLEAFVAKVAENHLTSRLRKRPPPRPSENLDDEAAPPEMTEESTSFGQLVLHLLRDMNDNDAALFRAVFLEELTPEEAAERLGIKRDAAYKRIQRLRDRLAELLSNLNHPVA
jgi:RNA polymerase sigma factor (sigma-70 family)